MKYAVFVLSLALAIYMVVDFNSRTTELNRLRAEEAITTARFEKVSHTKAALEAQIAYATSEAAALKWAYENHMARPGDYMVVPVLSAQNTPVPTPQLVVSPTEVTNLGRWLSLFFDPAPPKPQP